MAVERGIDFYDWLRSALPAILPVISVILAYIGLRSKQRHALGVVQQAQIDVSGVDLRIELAVEKAGNKLSNELDVKHSENLQHLNSIEDQLRTAIAAGDEKIDEKIDRTYRDFGETVAAQRERINQFELFVRDNYVSKADLNIQLGEIRADTRSINEQLTKMQVSLAKLRSGPIRRHNEEDEGDGSS